MVSFCIQFSRPPSSSPPSSILFIPPTPFPHPPNFLRLRQTHGWNSLSGRAQMETKSVYVDKGDGDKITA